MMCLSLWSVNICCSTPLTLKCFIKNGYNVVFILCNLICVEFQQTVNCSSGLSHSEAGKLDSFLHFTESKSLKKKSILEMADLNPAIDFMDVLSEDVPKGKTTELSNMSTCIQISHLSGFAAWISTHKHIVIDGSCNL